MQLDTSGDGVLSAEEIREGVERSGFKLPHDVDAIIESIDTSGTGTIDYTGDTNVLECEQWIKIRSVFPGG